MVKLIYKILLYARLLYKQIRGVSIPIVEVSAEQVIPHLFEKLYQENSAIYIIKNFIPPETIPALVQQLKALPAVSTEKETFGYCYGRNLMNAKSVEEYLQEEPVYADYLHSIHLDFDHLIQNNLQKHSNIPIGRLSLEEKKYFSSSIRFMHPQGGGIKPHTELLHYDYFESCKHLTNILNLENEISAFCVLQKPDDGGKLRVYNCTFNEFQHIRPKELAYNYMIRSGFIDIDPDPGDLVLFGGGQRWHCITQISGSRDRITIGNFFCFSKSNEQVYYFA